MPAMGPIASEEALYTAQHLVFTLARYPKLEFKILDTRWQQHGGGEQKINL